MPPLPDEAAAAKKPRSCATCRSRKVRCDKKSPCSNCRRAGIACVLPPTDKTPRWAYRIERHGNNAPDAVGSRGSAGAGGGGGGGVTQVLSRLNSLEGLIKELSGQIELVSHSKAPSEASPGGGGAASSSSPAGEASPESADGGGGVARSQKQFGRLVVDETRQSRYVGTGFWTRINDEIMALKTDTQALAPDQQQEPSSDEDLEDDDFPSNKGTPSTLELGRTPSDRHAFFFGSSPSFAGDDLGSLHPLPSQVPFILNIFQENINSMCLIVHMPSLHALTRKQLPSTSDSLSAPDEALLFAIYYATITSMEDADVLASFGASKAELNLKYRTGLERALAKADFLNVSSLTLVQALVIFLTLARRHDSPRYVLMVTSVVVRMAQVLGMHRDGTSFAHLSPFDVEMRRRVWWTLCVLDLRSSEDQNIDPVIPHGSFDTKIPLNINVSDLDPSFAEPPIERQGLTDMTVPLVWFRQVAIMAQMTAMIAKHGPEEGLGHLLQLLSDLGDTTERLYLQHAHPAVNAEYWMSVGVTRIIVAKMTLFMYLPRLFSSSSSTTSSDDNGKLLAAAVEIAELNHTLSASKECAPWRWIFQTYTHWHAIVFLLLAASREEWSPVVERAWMALHSPWLIPRETTKAMMSLRTWVPLKKLMVQAKRHRESEIVRLKLDPDAAQRLYEEDLRVQQPTSAGFAALEAEAGTMQELFRQRWRQLVAPDNISQSGSSGMSQPPAAAVAGGGQQQEYWAGMQMGELGGMGDGDASFLFGDVSLSPGDLDIDLDSSMDWAQWIQSAEGTEKQGHFM